jgi:glycosyltransferase involved in cell wall biosynthesis
MGRKIALILMVKNESKILERCLKSVEGLVDAYCITDTGSADTTCDIAKEFLKTHEGCLTTCEWKDFGTNRTISVQSAQTYLAKKGWDLKETYGLLLDADMEFEAGTLKDQTLGDVGYTIVQKAGTLVYPNCRLIRLDYPWTCKGVTHEYWDGPTKPLGQDICWIDDRNDGGCKADKFERDARLLEKGLADEPDNVRYMFYLAQTYHSLGRWKDSIRLYKKRIHSGGWYEEVWYSHYMIGQCYLSLGDPIRFEGWMLRAYAKNPRRAEPLYKLAKYFREKAEPIKAYHYAKLGSALPLSTESLFVETDVYTRLFDYEMTIVLFYLGLPKREGLRASLRYMLTHSDLSDVVYRNMGFYTEPQGESFVNHPIPRDAMGLDFHPTSTSLVEVNGKTYHNVRFVNYAINQTNGGYSMKEGGYSDTHKVRTRNCLWDGERAIPMDETSNTLPRRDARILGLEDVRVYRSGGGVKFVAVSSEHSESIRIVHGTYDLDRKRLSDCRVLDSPTNASCEKNWIPIHDDPRIIYRWYPFETYTIDDSKMVLKDQYPTPWFFQHVRGSAVPVRMGDELWALAHCVEYSTPRKYFHFFVSLDPVSLRPKAITLPFVFQAQGIEYCIGVQSMGSYLTCIFSSWDDNPRSTDIYAEDLEWIQL